MLAPLSMADDDHWQELHVHDENNEAGLGDTVRVMESSSFKTKHVGVSQIVRRAK